MLKGLRQVASDTPTYSSSVKSWLMTTTSVELIGNLSAVSSQWTHGSSGAESARRRRSRPGPQPCVTIHG